MTTTNQWMSFVEIEQIVVQRVANAIETIAIYETKTRMAHESMSQTKQQEDKVAENANNKRKWEGYVFIHQISPILLISHTHLLHSPKMDFLFMIWGLNCIGELTGWYIRRKDEGVKMYKEFRLPIVVFRLKMYGYISY
uniref:Uncharacterized protein n=1 Tax=Tanacetum cinerariifolium TaxID=118510 RepID=A0A699GKL0_TANCI|nr:hypothetical protein [Tanacetum cinerariifolium]